MHDEGSTPLVFLSLALNACIIAFLVYTAWPTI